MEYFKNHSLDELLQKCRPFLLNSIRVHVKMQNKYIFLKTFFKAKLPNLLFNTPCFLSALVWFDNPSESSSVKLTGKHYLQQNKLVVLVH